MDMFSARFQQHSPKEIYCLSQFLCVQSLRMRGSVLNQFFATTSIRGLSKVKRSESAILRGLWLFYLIGMLILLLYSSIKIFREFLEYNTTLQSWMKIDSPSPFPSMTICGHQPFSKQAVDVWSNGELSPANFSQLIRDISQTHFSKGTRDSIMIAERTYMYDRIRIYFQNLASNVSQTISHELSDILLYCVHFNRNGIFVGRVDDCGIEVKRQTFPDYFNCYTISPKPKHTLSTKILRLIVHFPKPNFEDKFMSRSFIHEMFQNANGGLLSIHEPNLLPHVKRGWTQIEPGKLIEISYKNIHWEEKPTPKDPCIAADLEPSNIPQDHGNVFRYEYQDCLKYRIALQVLKKCRCVVTDYPRVVIPNETYPYCGKIGGTNELAVRKFHERVNCVHKATSKDDPSEFPNVKCLPRCVAQKFETHVSSTTWKPTEWQLNWLLLLTKSWNIISEGSKRKDWELHEARTTITKYLKATSMEDLEKGRQDAILFREDQEYACISLSREANDTLVKQERLGLSMYGLVSRIGGSCSLYLGLTCAFAIELIEFCFLVRSEASRTENNNEESAKQNNSENHDRLNNSPRQEIFCATVPLRDGNRRGSIDIWERKSATSKNEEYT